MTLLEPRQTPDPSLLGEKLGSASSERDLGCPGCREPSDATALFGYGCVFAESLHLPVGARSMDR